MEVLKDYSVVVPVYQGAESLRELFDRTKTTFDKLGKSFEIIFVEDGGTDNSWEIICRLKAEYPLYISAIRLAKNFGQHNAIFCGLHYMKGKFAITLDDDLQIPPEEIRKLIEKQEENKSDLVYGSFIRKKHGFVRNQGSKILKDSSGLRNKTHAKGSSFKLFTRDLVEKILIHHQNFIYIDELLLWYTRYIDFAPVIHEKRKYRKSTYTFRKLFRLFINVTIHYTVVPLRALTYGGLILSIASFMTGIYFIIRKLIFNVPLGFTSLIVTILFSTSIILLSLGVIGEYLNRMNTLQNKKPPYSIKEIL